MENIFQKTEEENLQDNVKRLRSNGLSLRDIGKELGIGRGKVEYCIKKMKEKNKPKGYKEVRDRERGYILEHRLVMEKHIGRQLTKEEVVHHKDGNKRNNDINNLQLMTRAEHSKLHNLKYYDDKNAVSKVSSNCQQSVMKDNNICQQTNDDSNKNSELEEFKQWVKDNCITTNELEILKESIQELVNNRLSYAVNKQIIPLIESMFEKFKKE